MFAVYTQRRLLGGLGSEMSSSLIAPDHDDKIKGVFSTSVQAVIGFGHTKRKKQQQVYVYAEEQEDGRISIQPLNSKFLPSGETKYVTKEDILNKWDPEPQVYMNKVYPSIRAVTKSVAKAERHYKQGHLFSAEYEFKNALRIDEDNIRATFGLGLTYLDRGEKEKGDLVFRRLVRLQGAFEPRHKHLFNSFGIKLRKNGMLTQALKYYSRAYQFSKKDENLLYNIARTLYEKGSLQQSLSITRKALEVNPSLDVAKDLEALLMKKLKKKKKKSKPIKV